MATSAVIRRRLRLSKKGIGLPGDNQKLLEITRRLQKIVDAPVLGGLAVYLHGHRRTTIDIDFYTSDRVRTDSQLRAAGARWYSKNREHMVDGARIHTVTPIDAMHVVARVVEIERVRVVSLHDLITIKLLCGMHQPARMRDIGDVTDLISSANLARRFAQKLPHRVRAKFLSLHDAVRSAEKARPGLPRF